MLLSILVAAAGAPPLVEKLNAELLSHDSATAVLESWCGERHLADPPKVIARLGQACAHAGFWPSLSRS